MKIKDILLEILNIASIYVVVKVRADINRTDIFNKIRGLSGVIIVEPQEYLNKKQGTNRNDYEFSRVKVKYLVEGTPEYSIKRIKKMALHDPQHKIEGLVKFVIQWNTLEDTPNAELNRSEKEEDRRIDGHLRKRRPPTPNVF